MINRRKRRDGNHQAIRDAFEQCGWTVLDTSQLGGGAPDLFVARAGRTVAVEVKSRKGAVRRSQSQWLENWRGERVVVRGLEDVQALTAERYVR